MLSFCVEQCKRQSVVLTGSHSERVYSSQQGQSLGSGKDQRLYITEAFKRHRLKKHQPVQRVNCIDLSFKDNLYWHSELSRRSFWTPVTRLETQQI